MFARDYFNFNDTLSETEEKSSSSGGPILPVPENTNSSRKAYMERLSQNSKYDSIVLPYGTYNYISSNVIQRIVGGIYPKDDGFIKLLSIMQRLRRYSSNIFIDED